jgi:flagellar hook-basal body complex protein FliE
MDRIGGVGQDAQVSLSRLAKAAGGEALRAARGTPDANPSSVVSFGTALKAALGEVSAAQNQSSALSRAFAAGDANVSLEETVIAGQKSQLAFQAALQVRSRVVQAYQEIMQMNV